MKRLRTNRHRSSYGGMGRGNGVSLGVRCVVASLNVARGAGAASGEAAVLATDTAPVRNQQY